MELLAAAGCVFGEKLNRIYIFGGVAATSFVRDEIKFIELGDVPTATTTVKPEIPQDCRDEEDWMVFQNRFCCGSFYLCYNQEAYYSECPDNLHFYPISQKCESQEIVGCETAYHRKKLS